MKSQFLKIAGVKSEKAFYKKFPTEAAFFKAHPEAKKLVNGGEQDKGQLKKLDDLTNFTNYNDLPQAAFGDFLSKGSNFMGKMDKVAGSLGKAAGKAAPFVGAATDIIGGLGALKQEKQQMRELKRDSKLTGLMAKASQTRPEPIRRQYVRPEDVAVQPNQLASAYGTGTNILAAEDGAVINQIGGNPTEIMNTFAPNTIYTDMGYEPLDDSSQVKQYYKGGKLTKAQTGAELFQKAGGADFLNNIATRVGTGGGPTGSSQLGKGIGTAAGTAVLGPVGGMIGGALGSLVGGLFGKKRQRKMENYQKSIDQNIFGMTGQDFSQGLQGEFGGFMKNGGETSEYEWVSHTWQPQKIAKFGEYDVDQLLAPDKTMDTLRTGGNLRQNQMFPTDMFAMGGDLKVYRGEAEPVSVNPFLPDGGETVMFRGPSHEDGGMPIEYGKSPVEVEGGEPAVKLRNGTTGDEDLVVFGNLIEPNSKRKFKNVVADIAKKENKENKRLDKSINMLDNLNLDTPFDKLTLDALRANVMGANMKLKNYADEKMDLAAKQSAINETAEEFGVDADALAKGKMKKAKKGATLAKGQTGITFPFNLNYESPSLTIPTSPASFADLSSASRFGAIDENAQDIAAYRMDQRGGNYVPGQAIQQSFSDFLKERDTTAFTPEDIPTGSGGDALGGLMNIANQVVPFLRPTNARNLSTNQILGELTALADNAEEPVYAQKFTPRLLTPQSISFQDRINDVDKQSRAAIVAAGGNQAAQSAIMAQALEAKDRIRAEEFRANQSNFLETQARNIDALNKADLQNLQILDTQQERQARAKSITKATKQAALQSIGNKYAQNRLEQQQLQTYENLYNFRSMGPRGIMQNLNPLAQFNMPDVGSQLPIYDNQGNVVGFQQPTSDLNASQAARSTRGAGSRRATQNSNRIGQFNTPPIMGQVPIYDNQGNIIGFQQPVVNVNPLQPARNTRRPESKNGSIVKAIKNL